MATERERVIGLIMMELSLIRETSRMLMMHTKEFSSPLNHGYTSLYLAEKALRIRERADYIMRLNDLLEHAK